MRCMVVPLCWLGLLSGTGAGQEPPWLSSSLPERAHDFGTVARGAKLRHAFPIVNRTSSELRIADYRTKCGCTDVRIGAKVIPPGTQTTVEATIDTAKFVGHKPSGLTLVFDRPSFAEVDLNLSCFIRGDLVMNPGQLDFGTVRRSDLPATSSLTLTYAGGRSDWEVTQMKTHSSRIKAVLRELSRSADGQIHFDLTATLQPEAPIGWFKDEITLITNDAAIPKIPISVVANVQGAVAVTPAIINFGQLRPGQSVSKVVLVRSSRAFSITGTTPSHEALRAEEEPGPSQTVRRLRLTLTAPEELGPFHATLAIETDIPEESAAVLKTFATVAGPAPGQPR
jgi:hypothetical protein